ncbi:MAG: hypothetical protein ACJ8H8_31495 [Geminicoccaceae bacterium]
MRWHLGPPFVLCLLVAGCQNQPVNVTYQGFECPEVPGLDDFLEAADADNDNRLNSDEFNAAFEEAEDEITPDGQLDRNELAQYVCAKKKAKAAAAAAPARQ